MLCGSCTVLIQSRKLARPEPLLTLLSSVVSHPENADRRNKLLRSVLYRMSVDRFGMRSSLFTAGSFFFRHLIAFPDNAMLFPTAHYLSQQLTAFADNSLHVPGRAQCVSRRLISCVATFCPSGFAWQALFCTGSLGRERRSWRRRWPIRPARPSCVSSARS